MIMANAAYLYMGMALFFCFKGLILITELSMSNIFPSHRKYSNISAKDLSQSNVMGRVAIATNTRTKRRKTKRQMTKC